MESIDLEVKQVLDKLLDDVVESNSLKRQLVDYLDSSSSSSSSSDSSDSESDFNLKRKQRNLKLNKKLMKIAIHSNAATFENDEEDEDSDEEEEEEEAIRKPRTNQGLFASYVKTKDELTIYDLPPAERLTIDLDTSFQMIQMGRVLSIVDGRLVVIESLRDNEYDEAKPLDEETILFDVNRKSIGKVFEIFGPVSKPFYSIRFNNVNEIGELKLSVDVGSPIYFVPESPEFTKYIFNLNEIRKLKGSDASWNHDQEPPDECLDYSDDEQEKMAKKQLKMKKNHVINFSKNSCI